MRLGLPLNIWEQRGIQRGDILGLRDLGLVELVEFRLPRSLRPLPAARRDDLRRAKEDLRLPVGLHSEVTTFAAHPAATVRLQVAATLGATVNVARELGAGAVTVHPPMALGERSGEMPGARWTEQERRLLAEAARGDRARELFAELLQGVAELALEAGVTIAIENMRPRDEGADLNGAEKLGRFVRGLGLPGVRVCLDLRKASGEGLDLAKLITADGDLLGNAHAAGRDRRGKPAGLEVGGIDWPGVVWALAGSDYRGAIIYEGPRRDAQMSLAALRRTVDDVLRVS